MNRLLAASLALACALPAPAYAVAHLHTQTLSGSVPVATWKARRDARVVKQDKDYSCGAASLATLLSHYWQRPTTESEILDLLVAKDKDKAAASFDDMAAILPKLGFRGVGLALSFEQLQKLKAPVIVFVRARKEDHFAVLGGISADRVKLADPSLGNRTLTHAQFLDLWQTRDDATLKGRVLAVLPHGQTAPADDFYAPPETSPLPYELLTLRRF